MLMVDWLIDWLIDWLVDWLIDWLIDCDIKQSVWHNDKDKYCNVTRITWNHPKYYFNGSFLETSNFSSTFNVSGHEK